MNKPDWIKVRVGDNEKSAELSQLFAAQGLHTVCEEALCPNKCECWGKGHATILILGGACTRTCRFCNVEKSSPEACDFEEPARVAEAIKAMNLKDVVLTSVTRDDLPDGGATQWAETITRVRDISADITIEVLIPDFGGSEEALNKVIEAKPDVLGHNLETIPSLYTSVRPQADYRRSLALLKSAGEAGMITKTGIMVGLGEIEEEVVAVMHDAREACVRIFYVGQYLSPSTAHVAVSRYVEPAEFDELRVRGLAMGFDVVVSAPLVRTSYHSDEQALFLAS